jgi:hypothetical protein
MQLFADKWASLKMLSLKKWTEPRKKNGSRPENWKIEVLDPICNALQKKSPKVREFSSLHSNVPDNTQQQFPA